MAVSLGEDSASAAPAITLEVLPAGYGDSLLLTCPVPHGHWRMLVDTGPDECWPTLRERLLAIPPDAGGRRRIDLLVVTHIDHDHIGAVQALLQDRSLGLVFGMISLLFFQALRKAGVPAELHAFAHGRHGVGLAPVDPVLSQWPKLCALWMKGLGLLDTKR